MKKLAAIVLVLAMIMGFAACGGKAEPETTTAAPEETTLAEDTTAAPEETTAALADASVPSSEAASEAASEEASEAASAVAAPTNNAEILALYNSAVNSAYDAKAGFNKERYSDNEKLNAGIVFNTFKGLVYQFIGIGAENKYTENVTKGNWESEPKKHYLRKSTLTEADLTGASCELKGENYEVVLSVKGGSSYASQNTKNVNAPIDKCGMCVGTEDKSYFDHKTGVVIYDAIDDTFAKSTIDEKYSNAKVKATINAQTGKIVKLVVEFDISLVMNLPIGDASATGSTHIIYKNFDY